MKKNALLTAVIFAASATVTIGQNILNSSGNVGIGTTSPQVPLHVVGKSIFDGTSVIQGTNKLHFWSEAEGPYFTESWGIRTYPFYSSHAFMVLNQPLFVGYETNGADLDSHDGSLMLSNRLGIGTKTPTRKLSINSANSTTMVDLGLFQGEVEKAIFGIAGSSNDLFTGTVAGDMSIRATTGLLHLGANSGTSAPAMTIIRNGNIGIGTTAPTTKFHINGILRLQGLAINNALDRVLVSDANGNVFYRSVSTIGGSSSSSWSFGGSTVAALKTFGTIDNYDLPVITNNTERMRISNTGAVLIGTNARPTGAPTTGAMLAIKGHIYAEKLKVTLTGWADYVFDEEYKLRSLTEVERFIKENHHLPEIPSAAEVKKNGIDVGENQTILLKKVEELTLYLIEQNKKLEAQQKQIDDLKKDLVRRNP